MFSRRGLASEPQNKSDPAAGSCGPSGIWAHLRPVPALPATGLGPICVVGSRSTLTPQLPRPV